MANPEGGGSLPRETTKSSDYLIITDYEEKMEMVEEIRPNKDRMMEPLGLLE